MTSVVKITRLLAEAGDSCTKVAGTPNDNHAVAFKEDLLNVCFQIAFKGTDAGDPSGAILEDARYRVAITTNIPYHRQVAARTNYDPDLKADDPARRFTETGWAATTRNQSHKRAQLPPQARQPDLATSAKKRNHLLHQSDTDRDAR